MSALLEAPTPTPTLAPPRRTLNHYVRREAILEGIVNGTPATALCGDRFVPGGQGGGRTEVQGAELCPRCGALYAELGAR